MGSGLIVEATEEAYHLSHDKLRQVLYEGIDSPRRRELHLRVADALEEVAGEPAELAHHYLKAKKWRAALEKLALAGQKAEGNHAWETALENYARALEVAEKVPDPAERRFDLLAARERLLELMGLRKERVATVQEMLELAKRLGDQGRIAEVHNRRIGVLAAISDLEGAARAGRTALAVFQELGDKAGEARVHREMGYVFWTNRDYARALEANFRALRIHRKLRDWRGEAADAHNITQAYLGMGDHDQSLRWTEETIRIYRERGGESWEMLRAYTMATIHLDRGDLETALRLSIQAVRSSIESGRKNAACVSHSRCGTLYLRLGKPEEALEHFRAAAHLNREVGHTHHEGYSLMSVGVCLEQTGDPSGARQRSTGGRSKSWT